MAKPEKIGAVAEIANRFQQSSAAVLTEYRGLTVAQLTVLRRSLGAGSSYAVVKNTLTKRAARDVGLTGLDDLLTGPTAIAFVVGDPVTAAKGLRDFAKANPLLIIKGGVLDGATITAAEITRLADLESREVLLAKLAGAMKGNLTKAAGLFQAPLSQMARLVAALADKRSDETPDAAATDAAETVATDESAPAPEGPNADVPNADVPTADVPNADAPNADVPNADVPTADVPNADVPNADVPTADVPNADVPTADVPTAEAPAADAPTADAPVAEAVTAD